MLQNQQSSTNKDHSQIPEIQNEQPEVSKYFTPNSTFNEGQNEKEKSENINCATLQHTLLLETKKDVAVNQIWQQDHEQQLQQQEVLDKSEAQQEENSAEQQIAQDQYPSDYDLEQDTYFQKTIKKQGLSYKTAQDEESQWDQPIILKQNQNEGQSGFCWPQKIEMHRFLTSQQYVQFINKNYLKNLNRKQDEDSDNEKLFNKTKKSKQAQIKKVIFKESISVKRFKQSDQVNLIIRTKEQIQNLNTFEQIKSLSTEHLTIQALQQNKKAMDNKNTSEKDKDNSLDTALEEPGQQKLQKQLKCSLDVKKSKCEVEQHSQLSNYQEKQKYQDSSDNQKQTDEDNYLEIFSSLQGRAVRLIK